jgi:voltage-gated potassium channel
MSYVNEKAVEILARTNKFRAEKMHTFFAEPSSSRAALLYSRMMFCVIIASVCTPLLQTMRSPPLSGQASAILEVLFDALYAAEALIRWMCHPNWLGFLWFPFNLLDLALIGPLVLRAVVLTMEDPSNAINLLLLSVVPIMRLLKALRAFPNLKLVYYALKQARDALSVPLFLLLVLNLIFSTLIFLLEPRENIETMPHAMWFVIVTITTVGYGDVTPVTDSGKVVASVLSVTGVLYMAMPLSIVGTAFNETWQNRDTIILGGLMRQRVMEWGLSSKDLLTVFEYYDCDHSGELDAEEFENMLTEMQLGLSKRSIMKIFKAFDRNGNGTIEFDELAQSIFPGTVL